MIYSHDLLNCSDCENPTYKKQNKNMSVYRCITGMFFKEIQNYM